MSDIPASDSGTSSKPCKCGLSTGHCSRWLPYVLLIAAALLYTRDLIHSRRRVAAANDVRRAAQGPFSRVGISQSVDGRSMPLLVFIDVDSASNLLSKIRQAEPARFPQGTVEGTECQIQLVSTNGAIRQLRAARLNNSPNDLYVGLRYQCISQDPDATNRWTVGLPALVKGAGPDLDKALAYISNAATNLPPDSVILEKLSNSVQRANSSGKPSTPATPSQPAAN